ncbi:hypothetical protein C6502_03875 [Candidatus Poribacteria bacterium]|nr:MAG: hypothetical protein C6502_03875 [Candidatus Poribacteria bacterium]
MPTSFTEAEKQQHRELDVESLATVVFRYLKDNPDSEPDGQDFYHSVDGLWNVLFPGERGGRSCSDYTHLLEAITLLERRGLVAKDICSYPHNMMGSHKYYIFLTSVGIKSRIDDEVILLVDKPEKIVGALEQRVSWDLDPVVRQYYIESLRAYQKGLYISSVICLGAASERAIHWLAESIESYSEKYRRKIETRRKGNISDLTEYLSHSVIPMIFAIDEEFAGELKELLDGLGTLYRKNRNKAGHPQSIRQSWSREDQEILLLQFRRYIATICEAIGRIT